VLTCLSSLALVARVRGAAVLVRELASSLTYVSSLALVARVRGAAVAPARARMYARVLAILPEGAFQDPILGAGVAHVTVHAPCNLLCVRHNGL
jgi:hypothetical protein